MTDKNDSRIVAAMFSGDGAKKIVEKVQERIQVNEQSLEPRRNVTIIKINKQAIAVPTVGHVQEISKEVDSLKTRVNQLASENRQLKLALTKMSNHITKLARELDNKIDKL
jgi:predicted RNase H-like nuclease (RuvC/YqgF family)